MPRVKDIGRRLLALRLVAGRDHVERLVAFRKILRDQQIDIRARRRCRDRKADAVCPGLGYQPGDTRAQP